MSGDGFTLVTKDSRIRARGSRKGKNLLPSSSEDAAAHTASPKECAKAIKDEMQRLSGTAWLASVVEMLERSLHVGTSPGSGAAEGVGNADEAAHRPFEDIVCYGVGHFGQGGVSAVQAALGLLLKERLNMRGKVYMFDPVLTENEKVAAVGVGFTHIDENEAGLRAVRTRTLFYMPHCGRRLYSNVLRANWSKLGLINVAILGNSFSEYQLRLMSPRKLECCCVHRLKPEYFKEEALPPFPGGLTAFNDTCLHTFSPPPSMEETFGPLAADIGGDDHGWC